MSDGCGWDLLVHGKNLDASGGDVALALAAGEELYVADAAAGTGTKTKPKENGHITGFGAMSEDGALTNYRIGLAGEEDRMGGSLFHTGQAEGGPLNRLLARCMKAIKVGDRIKVEITNAAAKMDSVGMIIGKGTKPKLSTEPFGELPEGAEWVEATTSHTCTADTWTKGAIAFPDKTLKTDKNYRILAAVWEGATLQWWRFKAKSGPDMGNQPGSYGGDTDQINCPVYFSHPPQFNGNDGVDLDQLCSAGDTAAVGMMLLQEL